MTRASVRLSAPAREQASALQRRYPTFSEVLQSMVWRLEREPTFGERLPDSSLYVFSQDAGPGAPGVRITYRYWRDEIEVVGLEVTG